MFQAGGVSGEVKSGYQTVARLGRWTWDGHTVSATASDVNTFFLEMGGPVTLRLQAGRKWWVWRSAEIVGREPFLVRVHGAPESQD